ncbi:ATP-binding cassette domain-containing protein [Streptomyces sp. NBC_01275]|uniref:ABC transporter ATP-binding protein n=1 Tax=Streptomyces sp. NBC_01275 TaxID=2903807 RepID=UPI0022545191|nr:ATP-binding cassette domain-containing protein [Streptomyces sp. NBC_01275]MCX4762876.1 ATP-binding cassette domain-containing protein [Streptomyces sp. NBC_01275]
MLSFDAVGKSFGDRRVLDGLTFDVRPGELFGFCGANGAGKTTAMRIALGVAEADSGTVRWNGVDVDAHSRRRFGYMPEERGLYAKMTPLDQLVYFGRLSGVRARDARRRAAEWIERLGVVAGPKDPLEKLSLGNQQKVQLIAALLHDPAVLVLDEPFSGLDPVAVDAMAEVLLECAREGAPVVFSSHQLELVERLCDRVGILRGGRLVAEGAVHELRRDAGPGRLRLSVTDVPPKWGHGVPGARVLVEEGGVTTLELESDGAAREALAAAQAVGRVEYFGRQEAGLADIFREAVAA